jgi:hypothetical protein
MITTVKTTPTTTAKTPTEPPDIAMTRLGGKEESAVVITTGGSDGVGSGAVLATLLPVDVTPRDGVGIEEVG